MSCYIAKIATTKVESRCIEEFGGTAPLPAVHNTSIDHRLREK